MSKHAPLKARPKRQSKPQPINAESSSAESARNGTERETTQDWTDKQRLFVDKYTEYGSRSFLNGAAAARAAGHPAKYARQIAYENLTKLYIREEIDRRLTQFAPGPAEVLVRLAEHARNEAGQYVTIGKNGKPAINVAALIRDGKQHLIKGITYTRGGDVVVELYDTQAALVHLGRHHKLFAERFEHTGKDGGPIRTSADLSGLDDSELDDRIGELLQKRSAGTGAAAGGTGTPPQSET